MMPLPQGPFDTILADPAWSYNNSGAQGSAAKQYETMSVEEICAMPVQEVAADNAVLLLWATAPLLPDAMRVIKAWGFTYKTKIVWHKNTFGPGFWVRAKAEDVLIATRGKPPIPTDAPPGVVCMKNEGHSKKPRAMYPIYERLGGGRRLELFARQRREGWVPWGNQLSSTVETTLEVAA